MKRLLLLAAASALTSDLLGALAPVEDSLGESAEPTAEPDESAAAEGPEPRNREGWG